MNFRERLALLTTHDSAEGDLARDVFDDPCAICAITARDIRKHIEEDHRGRNAAALKALALAHRSRTKNGSWWIACVFCEPFPDGSFRHHYEDAKDPKARRHMAQMRTREALASRNTW